jgi:ABC-type transport system involved in multi-copper enzyme maturation permease subunit
MTTVEIPPATPQHTPRNTGPWNVTLSGVKLIAALELRQRVRSTKWKWALAAFFVLVGSVTLLLVWAVSQFNYDYSGTPADDPLDSGGVIFGTVVFFVLFLGLLVSPTLSATSINGDSKEGTLVPLQATALSAFDIVLGKLVGAWLASLAFIVTALPFLIFAAFASAAPVGAVIVTVLVLAVELLVVCALGLGWSAIASRTPASAVLTFVSVATLTVLSLVFFFLSMPLTMQDTKVRVYESSYYDGETGESECEWKEYTYSEPRTDRTWWLLAMNPFVIVADAAPSKDDASRDVWGNQTMLGSVKYLVRQARLGPEQVRDHCWTGESGDLPEFQDRRDDLVDLSVVWPFGLALHTLLSVGAVVIAVRRVSVPYGKMSTGTRVA